MVQLVWPKTRLIVGKLNNAAEQRCAASLCDRGQKDQARWSKKVNIYILKDIGLIRITIIIVVVTKELAGKCQITRLQKGLDG